MKTIKPYINVSPKTCKDGLYYGPKEKFGIYVLCDSTAGTSISIIKTSPGDAVIDDDEKRVGTWPLENRFWQDSSWAKGVKSVQWSKDGLRLTVVTGATHGNDKKYELDLPNKKVISELKS